MSSAAIQAVINKLQEMQDPASRSSSARASPTMADNNQDEVIKAAQDIEARMREEEEEASSSQPSTSTPTHEQLLKDMGITVPQQQQVSPKSKEKLIDALTKISNALGKVNSKTPISEARALSTDTGENVYQCNQCDYWSHNKYYWKQHVDLVHNAERVYKCPFCDYAGKRSHSLKEHLVVHSNYRPYECNLCNASFRKKGHLTNHVRMHSQKRAVEGESLNCTLCDKYLNDQGAMFAHLRAIHKSNEGVYVCEYCQYATVQKTNMVMHMNAHGNPKTLCCNICGHQACHSNILQEHFRNTHPKSQITFTTIQSATSQPVILMKCTECGFTAGSNDALRQHMYTHIDEEAIEEETRPKPPPTPPSLRKMLTSTNATAIITNITPTNPTTSHAFPITIEQQASKVQAIAQSAASQMNASASQCTYKCSECSYTCTEAFTFITHMVTHKNEPESKTSESTRKFTKRGQENTSEGVTKPTSIYAAAGLNEPHYPPEIPGATLVPPTPDDPNSQGWYQCTICGYFGQQKTIKSHIWKHAGHKDVSYPLFQNGPLSIYDKTPIGVRKLTNHNPMIKERNEAEIEDMIEGRLPMEIEEIGEDERQDIASRMYRLDTEQRKQDFGNKMYHLKTMEQRQNGANAKKNQLQSSEIETEMADIPEEGVLYDTSTISHVIQEVGDQIVYSQHGDVLPEEGTQRYYTVAGADQIDDDEVDGHDCRVEVDGQDCRVEVDGQDCRVEVNEQDCHVEIMEPDCRVEVMGQDEQIEEDGQFEQGEYVTQNIEEQYEEGEYVTQNVQEQYEEGEYVEQNVQEQYEEGEYVTQNVEEDEDVEYVGQNVEEDDDVEYVGQDDEVEYDHVQNVEQYEDVEAQDCDDDNAYQVGQDGHVELVGQDRHVEVSGQHEVHTVEYTHVELVGQDRHVEVSGQHEVQPMEYTQETRSRKRKRKAEEERAEETEAKIMKLMREGQYHQQDNDDVGGIEIEIGEVNSAAGQADESVAIVKALTNTKRSQEEILALLALLESHQGKQPKKTGICKSLLAVIEQLRERSKSVSEDDVEVEELVIQQEGDEEEDEDEEEEEVEEEEEEEEDTTSSEDSTQPDRGRRIEGIDLLHKNMEKMHPEGFRCKLCHYFSLSAGNMKNHMKTHTPKSPHECSLCDFEATSSAELQDHMLIHCKMRTFQCRLCLAVYHYKAQLRAHMKSHSNQEQQQQVEMAARRCDRCCEVFASIDKLNKHQETKCKPPEICELCNCRKGRRRPHKCKKMHNCDSCDEVFPNMAALKHHSKEHANDATPESLQCELCEFQATSQRSLKSHQKRHRNDQRFVEQPLEQYKCNLCGYVCHHLPSLKSHMWRHASDKKYSYEQTNDVINRALENTTNSSASSTTATGNRTPNKSPSSSSSPPLSEFSASTGRNVITFRCCQCGFESPDKTTLNDHMISHTDIIQKTLEVNKGRILGKMVAKLQMAGGGAKSKGSPTKGSPTKIKPEKRK